MNLCEFERREIDLVAEKLRPESLVEDYNNVIYPATANAKPRWQLGSREAFQETRDQPDCSVLN